MNVCMLILKQPNLNDAISFYKTLGLPLKFQVKNSWAEFEIGAVKLGLCPTDHEAMERHTGIVLQVQGLKELYERLKNQLTFKSEPIEKVHGIMVSIIDPGKNIIDLYEPTPEKVQKLMKDIVKKDEEQQGEMTGSNSKSRSFDENAQA